MYPARITVYPILKTFYILHRQEESIWHRDVLQVKGVINDLDGSRFRRISVNISVLLKLFQMRVDRRGRLKLYLFTNFTYRRRITFNLSRRELVNVPLIGTVAAGAPILADENVENYFPIPAELLPNSETFMLKVRGNSMIDVGI